MKERVLDTNIILRFLVGDHPGQFESSKKLISKIEQREETVFLPLPCACEVIFTLHRFYRIPREEISGKCSALFSLPGLHIPSKVTFLRALELFAARNISFTDAFVAAEMKERGVDEIYSFDRDFDGMAGITRLEPETL